MNGVVKKVLPGTEHQDIYLFLDGKKVGVARTISSAGDWCALTLTSGEIHDRLLQLEEVRELNLKDIFFMFSVYTGEYYGCTMKDTQRIDVLFRDIIAINSFDLSHGLMSEQFREFPGYRSVSTSQ